MPDDAAEKKDAGDFDVVMPHGKTPDGAGTQVIRARPGRLETGEVRPMRDGKPLTAGEVVSLSQRADAPGLFDVKVEHVVEGAAPKGTHAGPAQVATPEYRESWERVFGAGTRELN
ncbi:MAG TPA: hypothetical protein VGL81_20865 [Polyangiaceae bacterium]|jgi:hypothetical protein